MLTRVARSYSAAFWPFLTQDTLTPSGRQLNTTGLLSRAAPPESNFFSKQSKQLCGLDKPRPAPDIVDLAESLLLER